MEREGEGRVTQTVNHFNSSSGSKGHGPAIKLPGKQAYRTKSIWNRRFRPDPAVAIGLAARIHENCA